MSFISERRAIKAGEAIANGDYAIHTNKFNALRLNDTTELKKVLETLTGVKKDLEAYYDKHKHFGRIVKFFDHHKILGLFGKKPVVDQMIIDLSAKILRLDNDAKNAGQPANEPANVVPPAPPAPPVPPAPPAPAAPKAKQEEEKVQEPKPDARQRFNPADFAAAKGGLKKVETKVAIDPALAKREREPSPQNDKPKVKAEGPNSPKPLLPVATNDELQKGIAARRAKLDAAEAANKQ